MAHDVYLEGALFPGVPAILLPDGNNVLNRFTDVSDTTAIASDVASGKYFYDANGARTSGTNSGGGGGSSRVVSGTFTGTNAQKGTAVEIALPYTGSGYPVALMIFPSEGAYNSSGTLYNLVQRYGIVYFAAMKSEMNTTPTYTGNNSNNYATITARYKSSSSSATTQQSTNNNTASTYYTTNATSAAASVARIKSPTAMTVFIADASYGFVAGIEYTYVVYYSS